MLLVLWPAWDEVSQYSRKLWWNVFKLQNNQIFQTCSRGLSLCRFLSGSHGFSLTEPSHYTYDCSRNHAMCVKRQPLIHVKSTIAWPLYSHMIDKLWWFNQILNHFNMCFRLYPVCAQRAPFSQRAKPALKKKNKTLKKKTANIAKHLVFSC